MNPGSRSGESGLSSRIVTAVPCATTSPAGGSHFHGALCFEARRHRVATCTAPRRVSVTTSSERRSASLMPTPAKPIPSPRVFVLDAMSW